MSHLTEGLQFGARVHEAVEHRVGVRQGDGATENESILNQGSRLLMLLLSNYIVAPGRTRRRRIQLHSDRCLFLDLSSLEQVERGNQLDGVIIETTGMADPVPIGTQHTTPTIPTNR